MKNPFLKISAATAFLAVVAVNYLANALPIGGVTTGQASDAYANLFTPAGLTFSIWGLIYLLLGAHTAYLLGWFGKRRDDKSEALLAKVARYYIATSLANIAWIFSWHYGLIPLSVLIMLALLISLIKIAGIVNRKDLPKIDRHWVRLPFSVYFGWITVATIANVTVFLVSIDWGGWGISELFWTIIVLAVGAIIGITRALKDKNAAYILVFAWAYAGIILKHASASGFAWQYPAIIIAAAVFLASFLSVAGMVAYKARLKNGLPRA